ncbi:beta-Ala-His dipeptidase [Columba livia]|uniref:Beta-Ala-His dipeptidase n=2 Tax=Columba livia TaxID=8932 RepID=A0A2I0MVS9_COLLI|nr:beta-Ala-His dipeptidase [Columba livia]
MSLRAKPWLTDINDPPYKAERRAVKTAFGANPDFIWDGSAIPAARMFQAIMLKSVMIFTTGAADDGEHSQNEKISQFHSFVHLRYKRREN